MMGYKPEYVAGEDLKKGDCVYIYNGVAFRGVKKKGPNLSERASTGNEPIRSKQSGRGTEPRGAD